MRLPVAILLTVLAFAAPAQAGSATLKRADDGHWWADAKVNGRAVRVLVDTGATLVALTPADARRAGIDTRHLTYSISVQTAAGDTKAAHVRLESVSIGTTKIDNVDAMIVPSGLTVSVLGMSYLKRLDRLDVRGDDMRIED